MGNKKFYALYCGEKLGCFDSVKEAQECIYSHPNYKKTLFTKKGDATSKNPNERERFKIYDDEGGSWYIRR